MWFSDDLVVLVDGLAAQDGGGWSAYEGHVFEGGPAVFGEEVFTFYGPWVLYVDGYHVGVFADDEAALLWVAEDAGDVGAGNLADSDEPFFEGVATKAGDPACY